MTTNRFQVFELRARRIRMGLTPEMLAEKIGVSGGTIRNIEAGGKPRLDTAHKMARFFEKDVLEIWPELAGEEVQR